MVIVGGALVAAAASQEQPTAALLGSAVIALAVLAARGIFVVNPNESVVLALFGSSRGTVRDNGPHWANPFHVRRGNPVEIAAVIQWQVVDTARALFDVEEGGDGLEPARRALQRWAADELRSFNARVEYSSPTPSERRAEKRSVADEAALG